MGLFDDAVPGGNITKPLLIALGALLAGKMLSGGGRSDDSAEADPPQIPQGNAPHELPRTTQPQSGNDGGLLGGGLGDLLEKLR
ncbi:hypothetical protein E0668_23585, partial [Salmonella enterica subsp. enterica]|nr:hypothetical protein [Salmonella enterica subsp. enterica serovar Paratyphi A]